MNPTSNPKTKNIIILIIVVIIASVLIFYFLNKKKTGNQKTTGSLVSQVNSESKVTALSEEEKKSNTDFLTTLLSLNKITIDYTLFSNTFFKNLKDNSVSIESDQIAGRPNPFAEFDQKIEADNSTTLPQISPSGVPATQNNKR